MIPPNHTAYVNEDIELFHHLLRNLQQPDDLENSAWATSCLVEKKLHHQPQLSRSQALRTVLTEILEQLAQEAPLLADLLRGRFWEKLTVEEMRNRGRPETQSTGRFFQQQRRALERFAALLHAEEAQCAQNGISISLLHRLPFAHYRSLFGVDACIRQLHEYMLERQRYPIVSIKGIGGIGKTAVTEVAIRLLVNQDRSLQDVIWISAKQEYILESGQLQNMGQTFIRLEQLFDDLGYKLGVNEVLHLPLTQKVEKVADVLRSAPYIVVLDNLESIEDFRQIVPWLVKLASPTQFLLTARETVPAFNNVTQLELRELDYSASTALMNNVATEKGVHDFDPAAVFAVVGGNPLALILTISQMQTIPPNQVLAGLQAGSIDELYRFIFWKAWSLLDQDAKEILFVIQRANDQANWEWLMLTTEFSLSQMYVALQQLLDLSLIQPQKDDESGRLYRIHRLTSTFLRTEVLGWK